MAVPTRRAPTSPAASSRSQSRPRSTTPAGPARGRSAAPTCNRRRLHLRILRPRPSPDGRGRSALTANPRPDFVRHVCVRYSSVTNANSCPRPPRSPAQCCAASSTASTEPCWPASSPPPSSGTPSTSPCTSWSTGSAQTVQTTAQQRRRGRSRSAGFRVDAHDLLAPAASASVKDGARIVLRRGRLLHLDVDGTRTDVWTTAPTVAEALAQLGYSTGDFVSVSRARRLPLGATDLAIRTPRLVTVIHDGRHEQVDHDRRHRRGGAGRPRHHGGRLRPRVGARSHRPLTAGETVRIQRVTRKTGDPNRGDAVPDAAAQRPDAAHRHHQGRRRPARRAPSTVVYAVVYLDGKVVGQTRLRSVVATKPTHQGARGSAPSARSRARPRRPRLRRSGAQPRRPPRPARAPPRRSPSSC